MTTLRLSAAIAALILFTGCETTTTTGPTGTEPVGDLTGTWSGYVWTDAGPQYNASAYFYQRSNGDLSGDFSADAGFCISGADSSGHYSGTSINLTINSQNATLSGSGRVSVDSKGRPTEMEVDLTGSGWCAGRDGTIQLWKSS